MSVSYFTEEPISHEGFVNLSESFIEQAQKKFGTKNIKSSILVQGNNDEKFFTNSSEVDEKTLSEAFLISMSVRPEDSKNFQHFGFLKIKPGKNADKVTLFLN